MTPQHIKDKIESYVELSGNTLEDKHRLTQGANFGYSLASQQTSELKAEILKWCEQQKEENMASNVSPDDHELFAAKAAENMIWGLVINKCKEI